MADSIKATPRNEALAWLAAKLRGARDIGDVVQVPVLGGLGTMMLGKAPEELTEWSYGNAPLTVPEMTRVPQFKRGRADSFTDLAFAAQGASPLAKIAERGAMAAGRAGERLAERVVPQVMERGGIGAQLMQDMATGSRSQVVKPKGGNWLAGTAENAVAPLRVNDPAMMQVLRNADPRFVDQANLARVGNEGAAIDKWLETKLAKYIRNEMATPEDPVRALAERGITHAPIEATGYNVSRARREAGFPEEGMATSPMAKLWEDRADTFVNALRASDLTGHYPDAVKANPWLLKVPPETPVYEMLQGSEGQFGGLGFGHLVDELKNAINPTSGLPENLRLKYSDLEKVTVPQAVERVAKINEWRAAQKAEADMARAMNPATQVVKEYPDQGFKWVELRKPETTGKNVARTKSAEELEMAGEGIETMSHDDIVSMTRDMARDEGIRPGTQEFNDMLQENIRMFGVKPSEIDESVKALEDALKYEGETMGHCVGGYCPDVVEGRSKIFSLRDKKGQPHVTIETRPMENYELEAAKMKRSGASPEEIAAFFENPPQEIVQIKGKSNRAPNPEYLPAVQDFVRSQNWSNVGDLKNAGLVDLHQAGVPAEMRGGQRFVTEDEYKDIVRKNAEGFAMGGLVQKYADGGLVGSNIYNSDAMQDPASAYRFADGGQAGDVRAYADGGLVANSHTADFDPARIDAIVGDLNALNAG